MSTARPAPAIALMNGGITPIAGPGDRTLDHQLTHRTRGNEELATREKKTASRIVYRMPQYMYIIDVLAERVTPFSQSSGPPQNPGGFKQPPQFPGDSRLLVGAAAVLEIATESMEIGGRDECAAHEARSMAQTIRLALISGNEYQSDVQAAGGLTHTPLEY